MHKFLIIPQINDLDESCALAKEYGFGFEFNDFFTPAALDDTKRTEELIGIYKAIGLPDICTNHGDFFDVLIFSDDPKIREISELRVRQSMEISLKLGAKGVVFHTNHTPFFTSSKVYTDNWLRRNHDFWHKILDEYPQTEIYMENMCDFSPELPAQLAESLKEHKNFGICLDYAHASIFGDTDMEIWVKTLAPYIKHIHINDNDLKNDLHLAVGDGKINWDRFAEYYFEYFADKTVLIETSSTERQRRSAEYLRKIGII